jgi:hypothetical protein
MYRPWSRAVLTITQCAIRPNAQTTSQPPLPIASKATLAVTKTAITCGTTAFRRRCNGQTSAMMNRAKATGVITARAAHRPASVRTTAHMIAVKRSVRSLPRTQPQANIAAPKMITNINSERLATGHCRR